MAGAVEIRSVQSLVEVLRANSTQCTSLHVNLDDIRDSKKQDRVATTGPIPYVQLGLALAFNTHLRSLSVRLGRKTSDLFGTIAEALKYTSTLTDLTILEHCPNHCFRSKHAIALASALECNSSLVSLSLNCAIEDEAAVAILNALRSASCLQTLVINAYMFGAASVAMAHLLTHTSTLKSLCVDPRLLEEEEQDSEDEFEEVDCSNVARALRDNTSVSSFSMRIHRADRQTILAFADAIRHNTTLQEFGLAGTSDHDAAWASVAGAVRFSSLLSFDLDVSCFDNSAILAVAGVLEHSSSLSSLRIRAPSPCDISNRAWHDLALALEYNSRLVMFYLSFEYGGLDESVYFALTAAIKQNRSLRSIEIITNRPVFDSTERAMSEALKHNITIQKLGLHWVYDPPAYIKETLARNQALQAQTQALAALTRCTSDHSFSSLVERIVRMKILDFFLPKGCTLKPRCMDLAATDNH